MTKNSGRYRHVGITGEINYSNKGQKPQLIDTPGDFREHMNYLEIPVYVRFDFTGAGRFQPCIFLGASYGLLLNAVIRSTDGSKIDQLEKFNTTPAYNRSDFSALAGLGFSYGVYRRFRLYADVRYQYGLSNVFKSEDFAPHFNRTLSVNLGIGYWVHWYKF